MKKIFIFLAAVIVLLSSVSLAEDLSSLSDEDLMELYMRVTEEMADRNLAAGEGTGDGGETQTGDRPMFASFREAVEAAGERPSVGEDIDYLAVVMEKDGGYLRAVAMLDARAKELYMAVWTEEDPGAAYEAFKAYAWELPLSYTEEITAKPKEQAELDAQAGKTVGELIGEGYYLYGSGGGIGCPTIVDLSYGLFNYAFEVDATFEEYDDYLNRDDLESLKVKSGIHSGFSSFATDLDYLADGTYDPEIVPDRPAGDFAADVVPPAEE